MMNRRHFIQIGATSLLALSANRFAMAKGKSDVDLRIVATTDNGCNGISGWARKALFLTVDGLG